MSDILHIYTRVSSLAQEEQGTSLDNQKNEGIKRAKDLGCEYKIWNEGGKSSASDSIEDRPVLVDLMREIDAGRVKSIFVYNTDRLSRNINVWSVIRLRLKSKGVSLYTSSGLFQIDNLQDSFLLGVMQELSAYDNALRAKRTIAGKISKIKQGGWLGGPPPYGYRIEDKKIVPDAYESVWVRKIFDMYLNRVPTSRIRLELLANGVKTRRGKNYWSLGSIEKLLSNTHYLGYYRVKNKIDNETIECYCDKILTEEQIDGLEKVRIASQSRRRIEGAQKYDYLVKEFLKCGMCGYKFGARTYKSRGKSHYYCRRNEYNFSIKGPGDLKVCDNKSYIDSVATDNLIWNEVVKIVESSKIFRDKIKSEIFKSETSYTERKNQIDLLAKKRRKIIKEITQIEEMQKGAFEKVTSASSEISSDENIFDGALSHLKDKLLFVDEQIQSINNGNIWLDWLKKFQDRIGELKNFNHEQKQDFLRGIIRSIDVHLDENLGHNLVINLFLPVVNDELVWGNPENKSAGYVVKDGSYEFSIEVPKKNRAENSA